MLGRSRKPGVTAVLCAVAALLWPSSASAAPAAYANMGEAPPGANDWNCKPTAAHPRPVILVHGTGGRMAMWKTLSPMLKHEGYCVFALNYGAADPGPTPEDTSYGTADLNKSAKELGAFVDAVRTATGAPKVDIVGHSQGGMMPRLYLKNDGGADPDHPERNKVNSLVALSPSNHGTYNLGAQVGQVLSALGGISTDGLMNVALEQQAYQSAFIKALNAGGETEPGVHYTVIATLYDQTITPFTSSFLVGPDVQNILLQSTCATATPTHNQMPIDPSALWLVMRALDPHYAAKHVQPCPHL